MKIILALSFCPNMAKADTPLTTFRVPLGSAVKVLDLTEAEDFITLRVLLNLGQGLVSLDKDLKAVPALAKDWDFSDDRKTITFHLKKSQWSDGSPILAHDFVQAFKQLFSPSSVAKLGIPFLEIIENAKEYKQGGIKEFAKVGVLALDHLTLQIKLKHPAGYFLSLLALPPAFPQKDTSKIHVGSPTSGAYILATESTAGFLLKPNLKSEAPALNNLEFKIVTEGTTAIALYEKNQLDFIDKIPSQDFERFKKSPDLIQSPWLSTYYVGFNIEKKPFDNKTLREALFTAIDRDGLTKILQDPQKPSSSFVPTPLPGSDQHYGPTYDPVRAKELWMSVKDHPSRLEIAFDLQEKNNLLMARLQDMLKKNLGIDVILRGKEWKSYLASLKNDRPAFFRFAWLAAFPDPLSHLGVFLSENPNNYTGYKNLEYDALVAKVSELESGDEQRTKLIAQAQTKLITDDAVVFPIYHYIQYLLIRQNWQGCDVTPMGLLYFRKATRKGNGV